MKILLIIILFCLSLTNSKAQLTINYFKAGKYELAAGHYVNAIKNFNSSLLYYNNDYEVYLLRGVAKYQLDDITGAEQDYTKAISLNPKLADIYYYRALARNKKLDISGAFDDYQKAIALDSTNASIYFNRAITYLYLDKFESAINDCNLAIKLKIKDENIYIIRGVAKSGLLMNREAIFDYNIALKANHRNMEAYIERGKAYNALNEKDSALNDYNYVLKLDSINTLALYHRAIIKSENTNYADAIKDLNKVIELSPYNASAYFYRAIVETNIKDYFNALNDYDKVLMINPKNILTYFNRAGVKYNKEDLYGALNDYNKAIELFPDYADAYYNRSLIKKMFYDIKGMDEDIKMSNEIKKNVNSKVDSLKYKENINLLKLMNFSNNFTSNINSDKDIQYKNVDIQLKYIFIVDLLSDAGKKVKIYDTDDKNNYYQKVITLSNNDSVNVFQVKEQINKIDSSSSKLSDNGSKYLNRAILSSYIKNYNYAFTNYDLSIAINPKNPLAYFSKANAQYKLLEYTYNQEQINQQESINKINPFDIIISNYSKAIELDSNFTYAWFNRAIAKVYKKDYTGAINDLSMSINYNPSLSEAYFNRGLIQIFIFETSKACIDLSKAGELGIPEAYNIMVRYCNK